MAKFNPPDSFAFDKPTEWLDWRQHFELYRLATKFDKEEGKLQESCRIYAMGDEAESHSFFTVDGPRDDFGVVVGKFNKYFLLNVTRG